LKLRVLYPLSHCWVPGRAHSPSRGLKPQ